MRAKFIPTLERNKDLMPEVIRANMDKMSVCQLSRKTGLNFKKVEQYLKDLKGE